MDLFPAVDPIPLPAPVWLFKALHLVTMALHFPAVHFVAGGLFWIIFWQILGRLQGNSSARDASGVAAYRLPVVLAYVINFGVPPLLFTQVLYGRGLYTSSILIGAYWIAVIALLTGLYGLLYWMAQRVEVRLGVIVAAAISLLLVLKVAYIYSSNMTLMLRPEVWREMYRSHPSGTQLPTGDPTLMARWLYMMVGSIWMSGVFLLLLGMKSNLKSETGQLLRRHGGLALAIAALPQMALAYNVYRLQPEAVRQGLSSSTFYLGTAGLWLATAVLLAVMGGLAWKHAVTRCWKITGAASTFAFLNVLAMVIYRDGIRDLTLGLHGYNVWDRQVYPNLPVLILFLLCFVLGILTVAWLASVVLRAKQTEEQYV